MLGTSGKPITYKFLFITYKINRFTYKNTSVHLQNLPYHFKNILSPVTIITENCN
jgi:hypothetical protein